MKRKVRLEFYDRTGVKHTLSIEGDFTVERVHRLLEYAEIVAGTNPAPPNPTSGQDTKMSRILDVINTQFSDRGFDSRDLWRVYKETWGDELILGAASTYLARLADRGTLERTGSSAHWSYRLKASPAVSQ